MPRTHRTANAGRRRRAARRARGGCFRCLAVSVAGGARGRRRRGDPGSRARPPSSGPGPRTGAEARRQPEARTSVCVAPNSLAKWFKVAPGLPAMKRGSC